MLSHKSYEISSEDFLTHTYVLPQLLKLLDKSKNATILDLGCGNGSVANYLLNAGFNVYGTDASETGIQIAKKVYPDRFFLQDLSTDDLPAELQNIKFDTVISTEVIEHLYSPNDFLQFCKKVIQRTGHGELIISTPYHGYLKNVILALTGKMDEHFTALWDRGHIKFWSKKTLSTAFRNQGFSVTDFRGCGRVPGLWKSMIIKGEI